MKEKCGNAENEVRNAENEERNSKFLSVSAFPLSFPHFRFSALSHFFMRVLHVIPSLSAKDGGPSFALPLMARGLVQAGIEVDVLTTDGNESTDKPTVSVEDPDASRITDHASGINYIHVKRQFQFYKVSFSMTRWLSHNIEHYDLVHIHALFSYASTTAAWVAARHNVPYIVRPLGVLNRWGMENRRRWLKRL